MMQIIIVSLESFALTGIMFICKLLTLGACVRVTVVVLCVYVCLLPSYLICEFKMWCHKAPYGIPNGCIMWISLKMLYSPALASFADAKLLDFRHSTFCLYVKSVHIRYGMYVFNHWRMREVYSSRGQGQMSPELAFSTKSIQRLPWNCHKKSSNAFFSTYKPEQLAW